MKPVGEDQMPDAVIALIRLGNGRVPLREDDIKMVVEKNKAHPARRPVRTPGCSVSLASPDFGSASSEATGYLGSTHRREAQAY
jgi:hypothetical protein